MKQSNRNPVKLEMNEWITCNFTSFSTVFQSNHDDERVLRKVVCNETPFTVEKISSRAGLELDTARSAGHCLTH